jgi:hypothetical protein
MSLKEGESLPAAAGATKSSKARIGRGKTGQYVMPDIPVEELIPPKEPLLNIFTFGWMEDGRLGYPPDVPSHIQSTPRPIAALRAVTKKHRDKIVPATAADKRWVCKKVACGYRHTLLWMQNCYPEVGADAKFEDGAPKKSFRLLLTGLNQRGLCEDKGSTLPVDLEWDQEEEPADISAGNGYCVVVTKHGNTYSFGNGIYGVLGQGNTPGPGPSGGPQSSVPKPTQVMSLLRVTMTKVSCGGYHVVATSSEGLLYSWGRNNVGQLSRGYESPYESTPSLVVGFEVGKESPIQIACGEQHTLALIAFQSRDGTVKNLIYAWGDESRGQLGSGDAHSRHRPQENRWVTKLCQKYNFSASAIAAGANHNLVLSSTGQVISWGAGDYGQLGHGSMWDDSRPVVINDLTGVQQIAAGSRHSIALVLKVGVMSWGYNGYGELGLGDENIRTQPTILTCFSRSLCKQIAAGDRHTCVLTTHRAIAANEDPALRPYFSLVEENVNQMVIKQIKKTMEKAGFDPKLLDNPEAPLPSQAGALDTPLRIDRYEQGTRYCMDSLVNPADWRRKSYEVCFEAKIKGLHLESVCIACARFCLSSFRLTPYVRLRSTGNTKCWCKQSGRCVCYWSIIRSKFDLMAGEDGCIMPCNLAGLLKMLRAPAPVDIEDSEEALVALAEGADAEAEVPRIGAMPFERWYRRYYDEFEGEAEAET